MLELFDGCRLSRFTRRDQVLSSTIQVEAPEEQRLFTDSRDLRIVNSDTMRQGC